MVKRICWHFLNKPLIPLLWALIFFVLGSLLISAITVYSSANLMLSDMREEVPFTVTVQENPTSTDNGPTKTTPHETGDGDAHQGQGIDGGDDHESEGVPLEQALALEEIEVVEKASYEISRYITGIDLQPVTNEDEKIDEAQFQLVFVSESSINEGFALGDKIVVSGNHISADTPNQVMIDEELAELNNLEIGDSIKIPVQGGDGYIEVTIGGIFDSGSSEGSGLSNNVYEMFPENQIYIPLTYYEAIYPSEAGNVCLDKAVYELEDAESYDTFSNEAVHMGLDIRYYNMYPNESGFSEETADLEKTVSQSGMLIVIISAFIFITVYIMAHLTMKSRYNECETLVWLGVSGGRVYFQLMLELTIIALVGFGFALTISDEMIPVLQRIVHDLFLQPPTDIAVMEGEGVLFTISSQKPAIIDFFESYQLVYLTSTKIWALLIGTVITVHAMIIPFWKIWKMDRNKILQKRKQF